MLSALSPFIVMSDIGSHSLFFIVAESLLLFNSKGLFSVRNEGEVDLRVLIEGNDYIRKNAITWRKEYCQPDGFVTG